MDKNNQQQAPIAQPEAQSNPVTPVVPSQSGEGGNKMVVWLIVGLIIIILVVGGVYWYLNKQQKASLPTEETTTQTSQSTPQPTSESTDSLNNDLNSVDVGISTDFSAIDQDLQSL